MEKTPNQVPELWLAESSFKSVRSNAIESRSSRSLTDPFGFGLVAITFYVMLEIEFLVRYLQDRPISTKRSEEFPFRGPMTRKVKHMIIGMGIATVLLYIRYVHTTASNGLNLMLIPIGLQINIPNDRTIWRLGWKDHHERKTIQCVASEMILKADNWPQITPDLLDGMPIVLALVTLNVYHPSYLLKSPTPRDLDFALERKYEMRIQDGNGSSSMMATSNDENHNSPLDNKRSLPENSV